MLKYKLKKISKKKLIVWSTMIAIFIISLGSIVGYYASYQQPDRFLDANPSFIDSKHNKVIVNNLTKDWNYYQGLNYTEVTNKYNLPGMNPASNKAQSTGKYNKDTLAAVEINYSGVNINDPNESGYISAEDSENQNLITYYMYVPIQNNKVKIELIDDPFSKNPTNKVFNGWTCDTTAATGGNNINCNDMEYIYDDQYYSRYIEVPAGKNIIINLKTNWIELPIYNSIYSNDIPKGGLKKLPKIPVYEEGKEISFKENVNYYEIKKVDPFDTDNSCINRDSYLQEYNGGGYCNNWDPCDCYYKTQDEKYVDGKKYYTDQIGAEGNTGYDFAAKEVTENDLNYPAIIGYKSPLKNNDTLVGFFHKEKYNASEAKYFYDENGISCLNQNNNCGEDAYRLIQNKDSEINTYKITHDSNTNTDISNINLEDFYYLVTRDTNIVEIKSDISFVDLGGISSSTPMTITSSHNAKIREDIGINLSTNRVVISSRINLENILIKNHTYSEIQLKDYNFKIGRSTKMLYPTRTTFNELNINGSTHKTGKLIIESGTFTNVVTMPSSSTTDLNARSVFGNDYDQILESEGKSRVTLVVTRDITASTGGNHNSDKIKPVSEIVIKSGEYGQNPGGSDYYMYGIYAGGRNSGNSTGLFKLKVEGGKIFYINGGPSFADSGNVIEIFIAGGRVDNVVGGAGVSETDGNRIISVTGGQVSNSVAGGSNSFSGSASPGPMHGKTLVYVGGNAHIGGQNRYSEFGDGFLFDVTETGSVFGSGLGQSGNLKRGVTGSSHVIVDSNAVIDGSVYGGGNYGFVDKNSNETPGETVVDILGGNIKKSVYGGSNLSGIGPARTTITAKIIGNGEYYKKDSIVGSGYYWQTKYPKDAVDVNGNSLANKTCSYGKTCYFFRPIPSNIPFDFTQNQIPNIYIKTNGNPKLQPASPKFEYYPEAMNVKNKIFVNINGGNVNESIYGGSNESGFIQADIQMNLTKGNIVNKDHGVYGGGKGERTFTFGNIEINTIDKNNNQLNINELYGGSEFGVTTLSTDKNNTNINVNGGNIQKVYGGGKGSEYMSPYIGGPINIKINNGKINTVFGGMNKNGKIIQPININFINGNVVDIYGGSDGSSSTPEIQNGEITTNINSITIGSKENSSSRPQLSSVYGGGKFAQSNDTKIEINSGNISDGVYGGGESSKVDNTNITINGGNISTGKIYGGGKAGEVNNNTKIFINDGILGPEIYGGGKSGRAHTTNIEIFDGNFIKRDPNTKEILPESTVIFGGCEAASSNETNINIRGGEIYSVFGGSNLSGTINETNVNVFNAKVDGNIYGGGKIASSINTNVKVEDTKFIELKANTNPYLVDYGNVFGGGAEANVDTSNTTINNSSPINVFGGSNKLGEVKQSEVNINGVSNIYNIFGGNNQGGKTTNSKVIINANEVSNFDNVYGGSNGKGALIDGDTFVKVLSGKINQNVFGGGNEAGTIGNTIVNIYNGKINNVFGGGNKAYVGDVDLDATGEFANGRKPSITTVNVAEGMITGNIYGSGNSTFVYGDTYVNIGNPAIENISKQDNTYTPSSNPKLTIEGSIFGGSETNTDNQTTYNDNYQGVIGKGKIEINGSKYINSGYSNLIINGSIFGSGNNSKVKDGTNINITKLGTRSNPVSFVSIQRANKVKIKNSNIELYGTIDRADPKSYKYSLIRIDEIYLLGNEKNNGTYLYLRNGSSYLKKYLSGYETNGNFKPTKINLIDDVLTLAGPDNRLYMEENRVLSVSNSSEPDYNVHSTQAGDIVGMSFLGMFTHEANKPIEKGIYSEKYQNGSIYNYDPNDLIDKGAYTFVYGKHTDGLTKLEQVRTNGFYTNTIEGKADPMDPNAPEEISTPEEDDGKKVIFSYVGVNPNSETSAYYKWILGEEPVTIVVNLKADKYSVEGAKNVLINLDELKEPVTNPDGSIELKDWKDATMRIKSVNTKGFGAKVPDSTIPFDGILVDRSEIPVINKEYKNDDTVIDANNYFALTMGTTGSGWIDNYRTNFYDSGYIPENDSFCGIGGGSCTNDEVYIYDSTREPRSLSFWLYHSKNLDFQYINKDANPDAVSIPMGEVYIDVEFRNINGDPTLSSNTKTVRITVNIELLNGELDKYGAIKAPGKHYSVFQDSQATIPKDGSFSIYQSLALDLNGDMEGTNPPVKWDVNKLYHTTNDKYLESYRYLSSSNLFPIGTVITMLDLKNNDQYYYEVDKQNYAIKKAEYEKNNEVTYLLEDFVKMGSTSKDNKFDDDMNDKYSKKYYDRGINMAVEEFIFTVDFARANVEVKNPKGDTHYLYLSIAHNQNNGEPGGGIRKEIIVPKGEPGKEMVYTIQDKVTSHIETTGGYLQPDGSVKKEETLYQNEIANLQLTTSLIQKNEHGEIVNDFTNTKFNDYKLGAKITIKRKKIGPDGNVMTDSKGNVIYEDLTNDLFGTVMKINGKKYYPQTDGSTRIELAGRITNVVSNIEIDFSNADIAFDDYVLVVETFVSYDGLYYGDFKPTVNSYPFKLLSNEYGLNVKTKKESEVTHDVITGLDTNGNSIIHYLVESKNGLSKPSIKVSVQRRMYNNPYDTGYESIPISNIIESISLNPNGENLLQNPNLCFKKNQKDECITLTLEDIKSTKDPIIHNYYVDLKKGPSDEDLQNKANSKWKSGTYRVIFSLYDEDKLVGSVYEYLIIRSLGLDENVERSAP